MKNSLLRQPSPTMLLSRLIESPDLVNTIRRLPPQNFSALVQHVGVEDAGEIVALATTEQLVAAFDEDLFINPNPGEREVFDVGRFIIWLEVILEAGDELASKRMTEMSEAFLVQALSNIVLVLDSDTLRYRMAEGSTSAIYADKLLESSLSEEIDGYLLVSKVDNGWDAVLTLILALDRDHRPLLERLLDRCSAIANDTIDDLDDLISVLSAAESISEDVDAERENRRSEKGYMEPRAAKAFLSLAREPLAVDLSSLQRDPITQAYFLSIDHQSILKQPGTSSRASSDTALPKELLELVGEVAFPLPALPAGRSSINLSNESDWAFIEGMRRLNEDAPQLFGERLEELTYLANAIVAGGNIDGRRVRPLEASEAVLATVALGAELEAGRHRHTKQPTTSRATATELLDVLRVCPADLLFRRASSWLALRKPRDCSTAFLLSLKELKEIII